MTSVYGCSFRMEYDGGFHLLAAAGLVDPPQVTTDGDGNGLPANIWLWLQGRGRQTEDVVDE